jgi:Phosphoesterase family
MTYRNQEMTHSHASSQRVLRTTPRGRVSPVSAGIATLVATLMLSACGGGSDDNSASNVQVNGTLVGQYAGATVCADVNGNAVCDAGEVSTKTDAQGAFSMNAPAGSALVATIDSGLAYNDPRTGPGKTAQAMVLRSPADIPGVISPLTTEVVRQIEAGGAEPAVVAGIAQRLGVTAAQVTGDYTTLAAGAAKTALLGEASQLITRFALASTMTARGDISLATGKKTDLKQAEQDAFNIEGVPRYDNLFVIILENETNTKIDGGASTPKITAYLNAGVKATNYHATGHPSEPNYIALGAADDWGVVGDDSWWCMPADDTKNTPTDALPTGQKPCVPKDGVSHNIKNARSMFTSLVKAGLGYRVYSESMNPGQDPRVSSHADPTIIAPDNNDPTIMLPYSGTYAQRHNPSLGFDDVRNDPAFKTSQRTMGGGQWDKAFAASPKTPPGYDVDQLATDLNSGDVGAVNYLVPDTCDDMHSTGVPDVTGKKAATDCSAGPAILQRGDNYTDKLIQKIKASALWKNKARRVGIVVTFDEGSGGYVGPSGCCGWNTGNAVGGPLGETGKSTVPVPIANYGQGGHGNGPVIFGVQTNQDGVPTGKVDDQPYSHISFVRTLQDMFALADPGVPESYMNRSKYTESYIKAHLLELPEYAGSIDTYWDAVRPMSSVFSLK